MRRRLFHTNFLFTIAALIVFAFFSLQPLSRYALIIPAQYDFIPYPPAIINLRATTTTRPRNPEYSYALADDDSDHDHDRVTHHVRHVSSLEYQYSIPSVSVLLADWEVLVIITDHKISFDFGDEEDYLCLFQNNATSPAGFSGRLPLTNQIAFKCIMPHSVRRLRPFFQPVVINPPPPNSQDDEEAMWSPMPELYRWNFLVYESLSTENDVVLFVKGVNNRQGINRSPSEFRCVFYYDDSNTVAVKTAVTSSTQEVFRCSHPDITAALISSNNGEGDIGEEQRQQFKVSLEIVSDNLVVPSVAYYVLPRRGSANHQEVKKPPRLCASTMVYNAAKFLKEWVMYHSEIGVDKFILYDNDSNDDLSSVVQELNDEGYDVSRIFWVWPKTQEAGFSHSAVYGKDSCTWMMYVDIDEFVFSPSWSGSSKPSKDMLKSLLPRVPPQSSSPSSHHHRLIGQVSIRCNEFGPSNQRSHPIEGVTQGYTCRRWAEQRHKSIVLLDAVDPSLLNAVHHFQLRKNYRTKTLNLDRAVVNHYKYQAWSEFQNKFRRRVSTYVVDWKEKANLGSKDRTPGLGFDPTEPKDWAQKFCEVKDERLKVLTQKWFGSRTSSDGYNKLAWER
ncbi:Glycosyltransferase [Trema orientale]|uniref:Glycosyltransferase family 92 protein n=1 Tax=Trema orientale TaxID=63057 RepID=A0A2P5EY63_TREOI|nr:Glycosyltransferase [Trema orientale]